MKVYHRLTEIDSDLESTSVAIGNFDGCHLGHQALLGGMLDWAAKHRTLPTVLTFYPHPVQVLNPQKPLERLMTTSEKLYEFERLGVKCVLVAPFNKELAERTSEEFYTDYLKNGLKARSVHVGFNFRFGKDRKGDTTALKKFCQADGIHLSVLEAFEENSLKVSSSSIRNLLRDGNLDEANRLLGKPYSMTGRVSHGDSRGHELGFPTANLSCPNDKLLPKNGVYVTRALWQKQWYKSVTNVGVRPTFSGENPRPVVEVHVIDFDAALYDENIRLEFLGRIRDEKKFSSVDELKVQIAIDVKQARESTLFKE